MSKIQAWLLISMLAGLSAISVLVGSVLAYPVTNVGLTRFEAYPLDDAVRLEWDTETELETAGFRLKRGQAGSIDYLVDPDGDDTLFIISEGGPTFGSSYAFTDETAINSEIYTYQLIEVEISGDEIVHGETTVTVGLVPTNTPIVLGAGDETNSDSIPPAVTETGTPEVTISSSPTPRLQPTEGPSAPPTFTPMHTTIAATTNVTTEIAQDVSDQPAVGFEQEQPSVNEILENDDNDDNGVVVALAQEDPEFYPGVEPITETPVEPPPDAEIESVEEQPETGEIGVNPATIEVIGVTPYPLASTPILAEPIVTNPDSANSSSSLIGKIYLWVAFIAALTIFTAAVLGAILLYTRQRSKE